MLYGSVFFILCYAVFAQQNEENSYQKLWLDNIKKSYEWQPPINSAEFKNTVNTNCKSYLSYDFVIVGAGTSGSILARRLSEITSWKILLIEAGGDQTDFNNIPAAYTAATRSRVNWGYLTTPQKNACQGNINQQCDYTRGKVLGGCSTINYMAYVRGNKLDYDSWPSKWNYDDVLPYFKKNENASSVDFDTNYRGQTGPVHVEYISPEPFLTSIVMEGSKELGMKETDYNGEDQFGIGRFQQTSLNGKRLSAYTAYYQKPRRNLKILKNSLVSKINFNAQNEITSITFLKNNRCFKVKANKEYILSAGSINTAQLLMLSGIGPKEELQKHNITPVAYLPVGQNMQDHTGLLDLPIETNYTAYANLPEEFDLYQKTGQGKFSEAVGVAISFHKFDPTEKVPEIEIVYGTQNLFFNNEYNLGKLFIHFMLLHSKSVGEVTLNSADPTDFPNINPNYLSHKNDIEIIYQGIMKALELLETQPFKQIDAKLGDVSVPQCDGLIEKEFWYCYIKHKSVALLHATGTARMGDDRSTSVVDTSLKVHGIDKLRVVDCSVMPTTISGHTTAPAMMIGEKMADEIKSFYRT